MEDAGRGAVPANDASLADDAGTDERTAERAQRPGVGADPSRDRSVAEIEVEERFLESVDQGRRRLSRRLVSLFATGAVGGVDVGTGVLGLLLIEAKTGSVLLGGLGLSIGFIALSYAQSELFTEDFLVPVVTVMARQARFRMLLRLWIGTFVANLLAGWVFMWFVMEGLPSLDAIALKDGNYYAHLGIGTRSFALAVVGGAVITLMTWMQRGNASLGSRAISAVTAGFLLGAARLNHTIVASLVMFSALETGHAGFGYGHWAVEALWAAFGNLVGGVVLVTALRVLQVPHRVREEQEHPAPGVPIGDHRRVDTVEEPTAEA